MDTVLKHVLYYSSLVIKYSDNDTDFEGPNPYEESEEFVSFYTLKEWIYLLQALVGLLVVTFMNKRKKLCPGCLNGYFGLAVPANFLEGRKRRKAFVAAFAIATVSLIDELSSVNEELKGNSSIGIDIILKILLVSVLGCYYFPLMACIYMGTLPACVFGLIYVLMIIIQNAIEDVPARGLTYRALLKNIFLDVIVTIIAGSFILYWFTKQIVKFYKKRTYVEEIPKYEATYVKNLFLATERYQRLQETGTVNLKMENKFIQWFKKKIYHKVPGFRYSLTILISCTTGFLVITHISILVFYGCMKNVIHIMYLLDDFKTFKETTIPNFVDMAVKHFTKDPLNENNTSLVSSEISVYDLLFYQSVVILVASVVAGAIAYIISIISICRLLTSYRSNVLSLAKNKEFQSVLNVSKDVSNISLVSSAIQYGGYQIAYLISGFSIQLFVLNVLLFILGEIIVLPIQFAFWSFVVKVVEIVLPIIMTLVLIKLSQYLLIKHCFLEDKGNTMALNNRKGFFIMSYFVFFYNILTGVFSCAKRIIKGAIIGILLVPRLDTCIFPRLYEDQDSGFKSYSCLLHLEALQSNPIVRTFVTFLTRTTRIPKFLKHIKENGITDAPMKVKKQKMVARNRWFVAYTLIRNPNTICFRGKLNILSILEVYAKPIETETETLVEPLNGKV